MKRYQGDAIKSDEMCKIYTRRGMRNGFKIVLGKSE